MSAADREQQQQQPPSAEGFEPPAVQDVETQDAPSVTAAGGTKTIGAG